MRIWLFKVPIFKLTGIIVFLLLPLLTGYAVFRNFSPSGLGAFLGEVVKFWLEVLYWLLKAMV